MDIIQSYFLNKTQSLNKENAIARSQMDLVSDMAMLSCQLFKKHGYTTVLYTSKSLIDYFKSHPYDSILTIDEEEYSSIVQDDFWSGTKLVVCSKHNNNYLHVDTDLFLIEDALSDYKTSKFLTLHEEPWIHNAINIDRLLCKNVFNVNPIHSYNCGIFGGSSYKIINNNIQEILGFITKKRKTINDILKNELSNPASEHWIRSVFIEQILLISKIIQNVNISSVVDSSQCKVWWDVPELIRQKNIIHLWTYKDPIHYCLGLDNLIKYMTKYYIN